MAQIDWTVIIKILLPVVYSILEYWLGKTNKVQASSVIELILNAIVKPKKIEKEIVVMSEKDQQTQDLEKALNAVNQVSIEIIKLVKTGSMQAATAQALTDALNANSPIRSAIADAIGVVKNIPSDFKELNVQDALELVNFEVAGIAAVVEALKK